MPVTTAATVIGRSRAPGPLEVPSAKETRNRISSAVRGQTVFSLGPVAYYMRPQFRTVNDGQSIIAVLIPGQFASFLQHYRWPRFRTPCPPFRTGYSCDAPHRRKSLVAGCPP